MVVEKKTAPLVTCWIAEGENQSPVDVLLPWAGDPANRSRLAHHHGCWYVTPEISAPRVTELVSKV
jgi:hypothetical protein